MRLVILAVLLAATATSVRAQWPTTEWVIAPQTAVNLETVGYELGAGMSERNQAFAEAHLRMLESASRWYQSLGFPDPVQLTQDGDLNASSDDPYLARLKTDATGVSSSHSSNGTMLLTTHPGFLDLDTPVWALMGASAVHEVYHGIQIRLSPSLLQRRLTRPAENTACPGDNDLDWLVEGVAAAVQIRWLEKSEGGRYGHPYKGSHRAAWVRPFDQSLVWGFLPVAHRWPGPRPEMTEMETVSWACDYGTWYFWYAIGEMIGRNEAEKVAYTQFLFNGVESWDDGGIANVDIGLKAAAATYDAITPYRGGLYDLYPEFVAQYLDEDRFYAGMEEVSIDVPGLFDASTDRPGGGIYEPPGATRGGPLEPLASRAWRIRVPLPTDVSAPPTAVRFTIEALGDTDRDDLHLIVDQDVIGRPATLSTPYSHVARAEPTDNGEATFLVRVANVAEDASETEDAAFALRVEVGGFYGNEVSSEPGTETGGYGSDGRVDVGGELPPGFAVNGPGPWSCRGGSQARAVFDLMTPDELGQDVERALPEFAQDMEDMMDNMEIALRRAEQMGEATGMTAEQIQQLREQARTAMEEAQRENQGEIDRAAAEVRSEKTTLLGATFVGQEAGRECQMTLGATLLGREGGAQIIPGAVDRDRYPDGEEPGFDILVFPEEALSMMRRMGASMMGVQPGAVPPSLAQMDDPMERWQVCTMTDDERRRAQRANQARNSPNSRDYRGPCPQVLCTTGQLVLESAEQGRIAGSFQFEVIRWPETSSGECHLPEARDTVTGHFNVASTDDGNDDNSLGGFGIMGLNTALAGTAPIMPGAPILNFGDDK